VASALAKVEKLVVEVPSRFAGDTWKVTFARRAAFLPGAAGTGHDPLGHRVDGLSRWGWMCAR